MDIFHQFNPNKRKFTWWRKKPIKQGRLDYYLTSRSVTDIVDYCSILLSYGSDYLLKLMYITISNLSLVVTPGNITGLLKNLNYLNLINSVMEEERKKYLPPLYNVNYIKENCYNINFCTANDTF